MSQSITGPPQEPKKAVEEQQPVVSDNGNVKVESKVEVNGRRAYLKPAAPKPKPNRTRMWGLMALTGAVMLILLVGSIIAGLSMPTTTTTNTTTSSNTSSVPTVVVPTHNTYNAQIPPVSPGNTANINLTMKELLISIAPNVAYHAWSFNGTVPGPILHVRQGQLVHTTLVK